MAYQQACQLQRRDPDSAALLLAQIEAERCATAARPVSPEEAVQQEVLPPGEVYDPIDLYCRLARELHWSDQAMDEMDYVRFFGYVDRLSKQQKREQTEREPGGGAVSAAMVDAEAQAMVAGLAPTPRPYVGEAVAYYGG